MDAHLIVLLLFQEKILQALGVFDWELDIPQHYLLHDDPVGGQLLSDHVGGLFSDLLTLGCEDFAHGVTRHKISPGTGDDTRYDFLLDRLRKVRLNVIEVLRIKAIAYGNCQPDG